MSSMEPGIKWEPPPLYIADKKRKRTPSPRTRDDESKRDNADNSADNDNEEARLVPFTRDLPVDATGGRVLTNDRLILQPDARRDVNNTCTNEISASLGMAPIRGDGWRPRGEVFQPLQERITGGALSTTTAVLSVCHRRECCSTASKVA